ncbi:glycosyltransferase family 2 protein [Pyrococcus sp. ST04]|uniref:glycosyltransferase family 2 protein n=1 Tax=Pyrococcus sp. ST04 TaxID=1183377 RepID=UPI0002605A98|nr:glycosyltransferase family 2 protein [Pyrococcus sp. ST04]AFK22089.1 putative glycosyl transferase family 2 protein [Pyrococcus sp. ST04]
MDGHKNISVIICTKNSEETLKETLESIKTAKPFEVIIIDGGSNDNTLNIARNFTKRIYHDNGRGLGYARFLGAILAKGEYVAYIDSDVIIPAEDFFDVLIEEMNRNCWVGIHAQIKTSKLRNYWERGMDFYFRNKFNIPGEKTELPMMACVIKREIIIDIGFDVHFKGAGEDQDFWRRVHMKGYKFGVSYRRWVFHHHRSSFKEFIKQRIWYGKGNIMLFSKYHDWKKLMSPIGAVVGGILLILRHKEFKFLPFFFLWGVSVGIGEIIGILELITKSVRLRRGRNHG